MIRTPSDPGIPYVHEIRSVAPKDTGVKIVWGSCQDRVIIWGSWLMIKADFHLCRDVHMCGQERSWQVFKKQQQYLSTSVGAALKWQKRPRKNMKNKKHMCGGDLFVWGGKYQGRGNLLFLVKDSCHGLSSSRLCPFVSNQVKSTLDKHQSITEITELKSTHIYNHWICMKKMFQWYLLVSLALANYSSQLVNQSSLQHYSASCTDS